jgi:hypothetical protein
MAKKDVVIQDVDGVTCEIHESKSGGNVVGLAPVPVAGTLEAMVDLWGGLGVLQLARRQAVTDAINTVRARATSTKLKASDVIAMFIEGKLVASEVQENAKRWGCDTTTAAERMVHEEPNPTRIHKDLAVITPKHEQETE